MADLPTGTVTFLFTDIEGSTRLWEAHPERMQDALTRHDALLRRAIEDHGGSVFKTVGDAFYAVFSAVPAALRAAVAAQRALSDGELRVRMALHTGTAEPREGDYFGLNVNRVARLLAVGHGGQILLSLATRELLPEPLPEAISLRDLGERRLKDLVRPERIFQVVAPELPGDFPPLRTAEAVSSNLPHALTSFIGREKEVAEVKRHLSETRLLTLTGPGGTGKTRLALQAAAELLDDPAASIEGATAFGTAFPHGVWLVELAPLADPGLVSQTVATALGLREEEGRPLLATLSDYLREKRLLLVLDNCEHLLDACARLAETLLRSCGDLRILATSREAMGIVGETSYRVPSLSLPQEGDGPPARGKRKAPLNVVLQSEAIRLFAERAAQTLPGFMVTDENAAIVTQVCRRLDGIPLAIELAAARARAMPVEQIAARLDDRFRLLTGGSRTAVPRQQTLRALIDWSYDLLSEPERVLLRRLAVFAGGWTLDAAEAVCEDADGVLDLLTALVDKSLVLYEEDAARYRLLETIRQYARDRLRESGEATAIRERQRDWFLSLAERAEPELRGPDQAAWLNKLAVEEENLRAALEWSKSEGEECEAGLRLAADLWWFWEVRGHRQEGLEWLEEFLARAGPATRTSAKARALLVATDLAPLGSPQKRQQAIALGEEGLALCQELGDQHGVALALNLLAGACFGVDQERAERLLRESLALARGLGDGWVAVRSLIYLAYRSLLDGDIPEAISLSEDAIALSREIRDPRNLAVALQLQGRLMAGRGDAARSAALFEESLDLFRQLQERGFIKHVLFYLAWAVADQGRYERAITLAEESLPMVQEFGSGWEIVRCYSLLGFLEQRLGNVERAATWYHTGLASEREGTPEAGEAGCLLGIAGLSLAQGRITRATRLLAAIDSLLSADSLVGTEARHLPFSQRLDFQRQTTAARAALGEEAFAAAWAEGQSMSWKQVIDEALAEADALASEPPPPS